MYCVRSPECTSQHMDIQALTFAKLAPMALGRINVPLTPPLLPLLSPNPTSCRCLRFSLRIDSCFLPSVPRACMIMQH